MPSEAPGSRSRDRLWRVAHDWALWPDRPLTRVYEMVRQTMIDTMQDMESRRFSVHRVILGEIAFNLLRESNRRRSMYDPMGGNQAHDRAFYGVPLVLDRLMDYESRDYGDFRSDMRFLTEHPMVDFVPVVAAIAVRNNLVTLNYTVTVGNTQRSQEYLVSCAELHQEVPRRTPNQEAMARELEQQYHLVRRRAERERLLGNEPARELSSAAVADVVQSEAGNVRRGDYGPAVVDAPAPHPLLYDDDQAVADPGSGPYKKSAATPVWTELSVAWGS